ncbi:hypothetical protein RvY_04113 [Ramazzottius varieornatus]|uniref:MARVEL domain-containing protein n=1 Tax=Ramazzottius varieornatus TaxID=947166 RepID=A0A1D1UXF5_RAMVA|nr:hypothetical protein RvY_04113 [Ramazzottius varieornatus]
MAPIFRSCGPLSLRTACFLIAFYTFALAILLLSLNAHDYYYASQYMVWSRIISFVFAVVLFFAAICLLGGLNRNSRQLHNVWILAFGVFIIYQVSSIAWNIYYYTDAYNPVPVVVRSSMLSNIIVNGLLVFLNVLCLITVHSHRETIIGL